MKNLFLYQFGVILLFSLIMNSTGSFAQTSQSMNNNNTGDLKIRIAEIEIFPEHLDEYLEILRTESEASLRLESGVISIFPMFKKESPTTLRLLEIYKNEEAYQAHIQSPHFLHYKNATLPMVKSLELIEMEAIDPQSISKIFIKLENDQVP